MVIGTVMGILGPTKVVGTALGMVVAASRGTVLMGTIVGGQEIRGGLVIRTVMRTGDITVSVLCPKMGSLFEGCRTGSGTISLVGLRLLWTTVSSSSSSARIAKGLFARVTRW